MNRHQRGSWNAADPDRPRWEPETVPVAEYQYRRADEVYAFTICKGRNPDGEKCFRTQRKNLKPFGDRLEPEDRADFLPGLGSESAILYRLPELIAATTKTPGVKVLILEGEKDVDTAVEMGYVATCNPFGALKWRDEFSPYLAGADVIMIPDHDDRGRRHAAQVVASISSYVKRVRTLAMPDGQKDLTAWKEAREKAGLTKSQVKAELDEMIAASESKLITPTPFNWIEPDQIPKRRWLYKPHYIRKFVSVLLSTGGIGKSSVLIAEALAMASGKPLLGITSEQPLRVWYWNGEDPMDELQRRFAAAAKHYNLKQEDIADRLFVDSGRTAEIKIAVQSRRNDFRVVEPIVKDLIAVLLEKKFDVLMIDPFVSCHEVNENDNAAIQAVAKSWASIADKTNCSIMLAHHTRKTKDEKTVDDGRGASALLNAARSGRVLNTMTQSEADGAQLEQRWLYFRSDIGKANLTKPAEHADWFKLVSVDLENSWDDGDEVGVVTAWQYPLTKVHQLTPYDIARVQQVIKAGGPWRADQRSTTETWVGVPVAQALSLDPALKADRKTVAKLIGQWVGLGYLKVVLRPDGKRMTRDYVEVGNPPAPVRQTGAPGDDHETR